MAQENDGKSADRVKAKVWSNTAFPSLGLDPNKSLLVERAINRVGDLVRRVRSGGVKS